VHQLHREVRERLMGWFNLGHMTLKSLFSKPATAMYPVIVPTYFEKTKGHIEVGIEECTLCSLCQRRCPSQAITVDKETQSWAIDPFRCVQCGYCVSGCPKDCLFMINSYWPPATTKTVAVFTKAGVAPQEG
jgi:formate hydrogenlyase subunit 6/NADH:ubiquinone oxidoreductase subunit I